MKTEIQNRTDVIELLRKLHESGCHVLNVMCWSFAIWVLGRPNKMMLQLSMRDVTKACTSFFSNFLIQVVMNLPDLGNDNHGGTADIVNVMV